jgi:hypothetical protein
MYVLSLQDAFDKNREEKSAEKAPDEEEKSAENAADEKPASEKLLSAEEPTSSSVVCVFHKYIVRDVCPL